MTKLTRQHHDLAPVMALMRDEICQNMGNVQRQVAPHIGLRRRHMASCSDTEPEERFDSCATALKRSKQFTTGYLAPVDSSRDGDSVFRTKGLEPHAAGIVQMPGDHADGASWRARNFGVPECSGHVLNKVGGDAIVGPPGSQERRAEISVEGH